MNFSKYKSKLKSYIVDNTLLISILDKFENII